MSLTDFNDTFIHPAIDLLVAGTTTTQQGGTYFISTSASVAGATEVSGSSTAYVFSVSANQLEADKQIAFRVTNDGKVKAGYNSDNPFLATDDNDVTTKKFTETNYIRLGGTNNVEQHNFKIRTHKASDNTDFFTYIDISEGEMALYHVKTPTEGVHAANKKYMDDEIAKIPASSGGGLPVELVNSFPASPTRGQLYMNPSNVLVVGV